MKRYIKLILSALCILTFNACTYDYEMPDYSNAAPLYSIEGFSNELRQALIKDAEKYGLTFHYAAERWRTIVREKDDKDSILYEGVARGKADKNATNLEVSYICSCMLQAANWNYYDICQFDFQKKFHLEISPFVCEVRMVLGDTYLTKEAPNHPTIYNVDRGGLTQMLIQKCESLGYSIADAKMYITEKDKDGNALRAFQHEAIDGDEISQEGAVEIDVKIEVYGFVNMNKTLLGTYYFKNMPLEHLITIKLTEDMEHEFVASDFIASHYIYNVDRSGLTQMLIQKCESLGYSIADAKMYITEKDKDGNALRTFQHEAINGEVTSAKDAVTIDVEVEVYAFISTYQKKKIGSYVFKSIKLEDIQHSTLKLSADIEHEFVTES